MRCVQSTTRDKQFATASLQVLEDRTEKMHTKTATKVDLRYMNHVSFNMRPKPNYVFWLTSRPRQGKVKSKRVIHLSLP